MSGPPPPEGTIDVEAGADRRLRRTWRVQRVGWGAMALVSIGALLGVFGDGPLAEASAGGGPGAARILYDRFARVDARQTIALEVPPELVTGSRLELRIDAGFAADYQLERATPAARFRRVDRLLEGGAALIVVDGKPMRERLAKEHVTDGEILAAARASHGIETMAQIRFAVLESDGAITIVPARGDG